MNIALIGYGKMGHAIELAAHAAGHVIACIIESTDQLPKLHEAKVDVAIEFTQPDAAFENIAFCLSQGIPIISGTTGWLNQLPAIEALCKEENGTFLYASNFSIGVNLFFELNQWLAKKMHSLDFHPTIKEIHHTEKKDQPSGTAITLAEGILAAQPSIKEWINDESTDHQKLSIISERIANVPGTHTVTYSSSLESIAMTHTAHDRSVFAEGAVRVGAWIHDKKGIFTMSDFINDN